MCVDNLAHFIVDLWWIRIYIIIGLLCGQSVVQIIARINHGIDVNFVNWRLIFLTWMRMTERSKAFDPYDYLGPQIKYCGWTYIANHYTTVKCRFWYPRFWNNPRFWNTTFAEDRNFYYINHLDFGVNPDFGIHLLRTNWYSKIGILLYMKLLITIRSGIIPTPKCLWDLPENLSL